MREILSEFYADEGNERVGFILKDGSIVEVDNEATTPAEGFDVCPEDLITFGERATATWHTHPGGTANLSVFDNSAFLSWPNLEHFVIGKGEIKKYLVKGGRVVQA